MPAAGGRAALEFVKECASERRVRKKLDLRKGERPRGDEEISGRDPDFRKDAQAIFSKAQSRFTSSE